MPHTSLVGATIVVAQDLTEALQHHTPATPYEQLGIAQMTALKDLEKFFLHAIAQADNIQLPTHPPPPRVQNPNTTPVVPAL